MTANSWGGDSAVLRMWPSRKWVGLPAAGGLSCEQPGERPGEQPGTGTHACGYSLLSPSAPTPSARAAPRPQQVVLAPNEVCLSWATICVRSPGDLSPLSLCSRNAALAQLLKRAVPPRATGPGQVPVPPPGSPPPLPPCVSSGSTLSGGLARIRLLLPSLPLLQ